MRCTVIGSWGGCCRKEEACSSVLLSHDGFPFLLDCGSGVLSVLQNVLDLNDLHHIFLSHYHFDHYSDAGSAIYARLVNTQIGKTDQKLHFYALDDQHKFPELTWDPYSQATAITADSVLHIGPFTCTFLKTKHPVDCLAIRVEAGGQCIVYTADTAFFPELIDFARGADLLISECSLYAGGHGERAGHMTSEQAGQLAQHAGCPRLLLTHLPLYGDLDQLRIQAQQHFHGQLLMAKKLMTLDWEEK